MRREVRLISTNKFESLLLDYIKEKKMTQTRRLGFFTVGSVNINGRYQKAALLYFNKK